MAGYLWLDLVYTETIYKQLFTTNISSFENEWINEWHF